MKNIKITSEWKLDTKEDLLNLLDSLPELRGFGTVVRADGNFTLSLDLTSHKTVEMAKEAGNVH